MSNWRNGQGFQKSGSEEDDPLRITKKVKTKEGDGEIAQEDIVVANEVMQDGSMSKKKENESMKSYKESLLAREDDKAFTKFHSLVKEMEDLKEKFFNREDTKVSFDEFNPCRTIQVILEEFGDRCAPWHSTLIINVLGKKVNIKMMENKISWGQVKVGPIRVVDFPQNYFLVHFIATEDCKFALFEGPWMIAYHYIVVQRWRPFSLPVFNS